MEYRKIYIENFGKIRSAEIELAMPANQPLI